MTMHRLWQLGLSLSLAAGLGLLAWSGLTGPTQKAAAQGGLTWPEISLVEITAGLNLPVHLTHAGDGSGRIFVVEQEGFVRIIKNGVLQSTPFLSITGRVQCCGEEGLLSVAFPPNYETANHFYVYYTNNAGNNVVARYGLLNADQADPNSEQIVLTLNHPGESNHNGGQIAFGPNDGYLYIAPGDGGGSNDPNNNAQRLDTLLGKMLRIDVETGNPATYTIPTTNPFTQTGALDEIWALGLRNPWRFSFDRQTGDLYIGDVGQGAFEEIDFQPAASAGGENYGWKIFEGPICRPPTTNCTPPLNYSPPITSYEQALGVSVAGGFVYRGLNYPRLQGIYFYADHASGRIWGLQRNGPAWEGVELLNTDRNIASFGEDEAGNLYLTHRAGGSNGRIYQIIDPAAGLDQSSKDVSPHFGNPGQTFNFTITLVSDAPLTETVFVTDTLPSGLAYVPGTLNAPFGATNDSNPNLLLWQGLMNPTTTVQITYQVTATGVPTGILTNNALVNAQSRGVFTLTRSVSVPAIQTFLPVILRNVSP